MSDEGMKTQDVLNNQRKEKAGCHSDTFPTIDETMKMRTKTVDSEISSLRAQLQQRDAQLAERDGRLLAMTDALAEYTYDGDWHGPESIRASRKIKKLLRSISTAAADARRRVVAEGLREAAEYHREAVSKLGYAPGLSILEFAEWLEARADSLDRPVA